MDWLVPMQDYALLVDDIYRLADREWFAPPPQTPNADSISSL